MRTIVDTATVPWVPSPRLPPKMEYFEFKVFAPSGTSTFRQIRGKGAVPPHYHVRQSFFYILSGAFVIRDHMLPAGTWALEPYAAIHEETEYRDVSYLSWFPADHFLPVDLDNIPEWMSMRAAKIEGTHAQVQSGDALALPLGPGLAMKVLHCFAGEAGTVTLVSGAAGAQLPARRYMGDTDIYVLKGALEFRDGAVATDGYWIRETEGSDEAEVSFLAATELLVTSYGAILDFDTDRQIRRVIDGGTLRGLAGRPKSPDDAIATFRARSSPVFTTSA